MGHIEGVRRDAAWGFSKAPLVPALIGEIEIDAAGMLREPNMNCPLGAFKLSLRLKQIER
jgi:hypothetical protein